MNISNRLLQIIDYLGITSNAFAIQVGISQPRMRNYLLGRDPDYETLCCICKTFVIINARWLLTGEGEMVAKHNSSSTKTAEGMLFSLIREKDIKIEEQAKEIGRLEERVKTFAQKTSK